MTNPALEFVKTLCKVLSLDPSIADQVMKLRRDLLKLICVGEFSKEAEWEDPSISYVIPGIICKSCNSCRDLDLCKEPFQGNDDNGRPGWQCNCRNFYDSEEIEFILTDSLQRSAMGYTLQDLKCTKCNEVKQGNMAANCSCGGYFVNSITASSFAKKLKIFQKIAKHYKMDQLKEMVEWIKKRNPTHFETKPKTNF